MLLSHHLLWDAINSKLSAHIFYIYIQLEIWQFSMLSKLGKKTHSENWPKTVKNPNQVAQC